MRKQHVALLLAVALGVILGYWWYGRRSAPLPVAAPAPVVPVVAPPPAVEPVQPFVPPPPPAPPPPPPPPVAVVAIEAVPSKVVTTPEPPVTTPAAPEEAIQENKTLDFSTGKPVMKDSTDDKAIIDAAVKEMEEATKNITFEPLPPKPPEKK